MTAKLSKCSLDSYKLELLGKELKRPTEAVEFEVGIDLSSSKADGNLTQCIATHLIASGSEDGSCAIISKLDLSDNPIQDGEDGLSHLCQALTTNTSLVELNLAHCQLKATECNGKALSHMLKTNKTLKSLMLLPIAHVDGHVLRYFSEYIRSSLHTFLDFSGNPIQDGEDGLSHLCQALTTNTLVVKLNLSNCHLAIAQENGKGLSHMLKTNRTLTTLILTMNNIRGCGIYYLSEGISSSSAIRKLDLSCNPIQDGEDGLSHLCQALETNVTLVELNLSNCQLTIAKENGEVLSHMLKANRTLTTLILSKGNINGCGIRYLSEGINTSAISKLDISGNPIQVGKDGLFHLCQALTTNSSLVELDFAGFALHVSGTRGGEMTEAIKSLQLTTRRISGRTISSFSCFISSSSAINKLDLSGNPIQDGEDGLFQFCHALTTNTSLVELNLSNCKLTIAEENGKALANMLNTNKTLKVLKLSNNSINCRGVCYLLEGISSSTIGKLDISGNPIQGDEDGLSHLCQALTTKTSLVELNLSNCQLMITEENCKALSHVLKTNQTLATLNLSKNDINGRGTYYLSEGISSSSAICKLDLSGNHIQDGEDGLSHLCHALATNTSLVELNLSNCQLMRAVENCKALSHLFKTNETLKALKLSKNNINGRGVCYLSEGISSSSGISKLDLSGNHIQDGEDGLSHLCHALTTNTSLVELNLSDCNVIFREENGKALSHMLMTNKTLKALKLSSNTICGCDVCCLSEGISSSSAINKLDLSGNPIQDGEDGLSHLCHALTTNTSLVELNLSNCKLTITEDNGKALSHMLKTNKTLKSFMLLPIASIDGHGLRYFSEYINSCLHTISKLDLSGYPIQDGEDGLSHLCQALATNTSLVELNLSSCSLHETCGPALCHMLETNRTLTSLNLSCNEKISDNSVARMAEGLRSNHSLKCLSISWCHTGVKSLIDCLIVNDSLEELDLSRNTISAEAACGFSDMLKRNSTLKNLNVSWCKLTDEAVKSLASALLVNSTLEKLDLGNNTISHEAACGFSDMLKCNSTLKKLNVSSCQLTDKAVKSLVSALEVNSTLEELDLNENSGLTDTVLVVLGESLKRNTGLKTLDLRVFININKTTAGGWRQFVQCLKDNNSLELLKTYHYGLDVEEVNRVRREKNLPELRHQ